MPELIISAPLYGNLLLRDHYMKLKRHYGEGFEESLAAEYLKTIDQDIEELTEGIDLLEFY